MSGGAKMGLLGVLLAIVFVAVIWDRGGEEELLGRRREEIVLPEEGRSARGKARADRPRRLRGPAVRRELEIPAGRPVEVAARPEGPDRPLGPSREEIEEIAAEIGVREPPDPGPRPVPASVPDRRRVREVLVARGETLWKIAERVYGDGSRWERILQANRGRLPRPDRIRPGMRLVVPDGSDPTPGPPARRSRPGAHVVRKGETLFGIARETLGDGSRWREILAANRDRIPDPSRLPAGARLIIPGTGGGAE